MSAGESESDPGSRRPLWDFLLLLLLGGQLIWVFSHYLPGYVGPDAGGLFVQARLLATEFATGFRPDSPLQFLGNHWLETADGDFHSRFPPGLPLALALIFRVGGDLAPFLLNPLMATSTVALTFLLGRRWLGGGWAFLSALLVATLPPLNLLALHGDAHVAATMVLLLGTWLLFRWEDEPGPGMAFMVGLVFGCLPSVRYPEAVVGVGVLALFLFNGGKGRWSRGLLPAASGAALPLTALGAYNALTFGAPWRTGYALTNEQTAFSLQSFLANILPYGKALTLGGAGPFFLLGLVGIIHMVVRVESRGRGLFLLGAVLPLTLLYSSYYWGTLEEASLTLRYFLPTLPLLILGSLWLLTRIPDRRVMLGVVSVLTIFQVGRAIPTGSQALLGEWLGLARGRAVTEAVEEAVPEGSVLIARREILEVLDYFGRWRLIDDRLMPGTPSRSEILLGWELSAEDRAHLAAIPSPTQISKSAEARSRYAGHEPGILASILCDDIDGWPGASGYVFWLGNPETVSGFSTLTEGRVSLFPLGDVRLPGGEDMTLPYWVPRGPLVLFRLEITED